MEPEESSPRARACAQLRRTASQLEALHPEAARQAMEELADILDDLGRWSERAGLSAATGEGE